MTIHRRMKEDNIKVTKSNVRIILHNPKQLKRLVKTKESVSDLICD